MPKLILALVAIAFTATPALASNMPPLPVLATKPTPVTARDLLPPQTAGTTLICEKIGQVATGYFTARGQLWKQDVVVGSDDCLGRCGIGCNPGEDWFDGGLYTQQCLNHDLCARFTGENMGDCGDEFWAATMGTLMAPMCQFVPQDQAEQRRVR